MNNCNEKLQQFEQIAEKSASDFTVHPATVLTGRQSKGTPKGNSANFGAMAIALVGLLGFGAFLFVMFNTTNIAQGKPIIGDEKPAASATPATLAMGSNIATPTLAASATPNNGGMVTLLPTPSPTQSTAVELGDFAVSQNEGIIRALLAIAALVMLTLTLIYRSAENVRHSTGNA